MTAKCPECGIRFHAPKAGIVLPCPKCGNPVAIEQRDRPRPPARAPGPPPPERAEGVPQMPWMLAAGVVGVLVLAHYALYLLITADARSGISEFKSRYGAVVSEGLEDPGSAPPAASHAAYKAWRERRGLFDASRSYADHEAHRSLVATGLGISLLVQLAVTAFALFRMNAKIQSEVARRARHATRV